MKRAEAGDSDKWMAELIESGEAPVWLIAQMTAREFEPQPWHGLIFRAFDALRFDRFYGAMGGQTPISYLAISQYCRDHGIPAEDMPMFMAFLTAVDFEYLEMQADKQKDDGDGGHSAPDPARAGGNGRQQLPNWRFTGGG